jgi:hypothetical protein
MASYSLGRIYPHLKPSQMRFGQDALTIESLLADIVYFWVPLISWSSKKHPTVSRSSIEAENKSVANATTVLAMDSVSSPGSWCSAPFSSKVLV